MFPPNYMTLRITVPHDQWPLIEDKVLFGVPVYIAYPHSGKEGENEHFHICVPMAEKNDKMIARFRKRVNDAFRGVKGNKIVAAKFMTNGVDKAIQYMSKEKTEPIYLGDDCEAWIAASPVWTVQTTMEKFLDKDDEITHKTRDWQLNYNNLIPQAVAHRNRCRLETTKLKEIVRHMMKTTKWAPAVSMIKGGVPPFYQDRFEVRIGHKTDFDMSWWDKWQHD